jgi:hypothetical protein
MCRMGFGADWQAGFDTNCQCGVNHRYPQYRVFCRVSRSESKAVGARRIAIS